MISRKLGWFARPPECNIKEHLVQACSSVFFKMAKVLEALRETEETRAMEIGTNGSVREKSKIQMFYLQQEQFFQQLPDGTQAIKMTMTGKEVKRLGHPKATQVSSLLRLVSRQSVQALPRKRLCATTKCAPSSHDVIRCVNHILRQQPFRWFYE